MDYEFQWRNQLASVYECQIGHIMRSFHTTLAPGPLTAMATYIHAWNYKFINAAELLIMILFVHGPRWLVRDKQRLRHVPSNIIIIIAMHIGP